MKYEICQRNKKDRDIWSAVAWSDTWEWANRIANSLNCTSNEEFAIFKDGEVIRTLEEAMKEDLRTVTIWDCLGNYNFKGRAAILNDGRLIGFQQEEISAQTANPSGDE